jgi:hypothetical protein
LKKPTEIHTFDSMYFRIKHFLLFSTFTIIANVLLSQVPQKFSYQAVVRDASGNLIVNRLIGLRIGILHKTSIGSEVYTETHSALSNVNGLITLEVGNGITQKGIFNQIIWSDGPYFIKTDLDPNGGTQYSIKGTTELLSVPFALYAKSVSEYDESDPQFKKSVAFGIGSADTARWNAKLNSFTETDPLYSASVARYISSVDTINWNSKQNKLIAGPGIKINKDTISSENLSSMHYIGEKFGGGVIFYLWKDSSGKEHGLIVSPNDLSNDEWSNITSPVGADAQSYWDGMSNCKAIIAQSGHVNSAAKQCLDLTLNGYSDWYLPAVSEFYMLSNNYIAVARALSTMPGATQISTAKYWTSTEFAAQNIYSFYILFYENKITHYFKNGYKYAVRPIRAF